MMAATGSKARIIRPDTTEWDVASTVRMVAVKFKQSKALKR